MADIKDFVEPDFLSGQSVEVIMARMLALLPDTLDKSEGGIIWDLLYPVAFEKAQAIEFTLLEAVKNMFPMWAYGDMLDYHGSVRSIERKAAVAATGSVKFYGSDGVIIEAGTVLMTTPAKYGEESISFQTTQATTISGGTASAAIKALVAGASGNVAAGSINRFDDAPDGVTAVTNTAATSGGLDEESDDDYRDRIVDYDQSVGTLFVGSAADYRRWALEVDGVGSASVVPASDGSGVVKIVILDTSSNPASTELCEAVYNYIMRPDNEYMRKAPIGAQLTVVSPTVQSISIAATLSINSTTSLAAVKADFLELIADYYATITDGIVRYSKIGQLIMSIDGVIDYSNLLVSGAAANVTISSSNIAASADSAVVFAV